MEKRLRIERTSCLTENSSSFLDIGTKFKPLLRTDFSESESRRFSGIVTTVLRLLSDEPQVSKIYFCTLNPHGINERFSFNSFILLFFTLPCTNQ